MIEKEGEDKKRREWENENKNVEDDKNNEGKFGPVWQSLDDIS